MQVQKFRKHAVFVGNLQHPVSLFLLAYYATLIAVVGGLY